MGSGFESRGVHQRVPLDLLKGMIGRDFFVPRIVEPPRRRGKTVRLRFCAVRPASARLHSMARTPGQPCLAWAPWTGPPGPLLNGRCWPETTMRNHGHPNQHLHASVDCTRRAELGAEPPHTRLARSAPASQRSGSGRRSARSPIPTSGSPQGRAVPITLQHAPPLRAGPEQAGSIFQSV